MKILPGKLIFLNVEIISKLNSINFRMDFERLLKDHQASSNITTKEADFLTDFD